jgi:apolipoprotein N-acyltransferase
VKAGSVLMPDHSQPTPQASARGFRAHAVPKPWLLLPALTGVLLWLCFYPLGWGFLGWAALVPLLFLVRLDARPWLIYLGAFSGGCVFYWSALTWMTVADYRMVYTWAMLSVYCALYFPLALFMIRRLDRATGWPLTMTVPIVWTALEFLRSFLGTGFAWYFLGHTQHHYLAMIQVADLAGVYAITFVLAAANGWLVEFLSALPEVRSACRQRRDARMRPRRWGWLVAALVAATLVYGASRLSQDEFRPGPRVALIQGNLDQRLRNEATEGAHEALHADQQVLKHYWDLCRLACLQSPRPDLVVWPETSFPYSWYELPADLHKVPEPTLETARLVRGLLTEMAKETATNQLIGLNARAVDEQGKVRAYNSALLLSGLGNAEGIYDKIHRVPFGEYVPLRDWLPFMNRFAPYDFDYSVQAGEKRTRFQLGKYRFGVVICYEDTDPFLARQYGRQQADGPAVDFLVNISNDGWFDGTRQHAEHLAISRFRAVETRRPLARAVNMGISAVIDGNGRVQKPKEVPVPGDAKLWAVIEEKDVVPDLPEAKWQDFTKVHGVLIATIPLDDRLSLYAWAGDWLPSGCWLLVGGVWVWRKAKARIRNGVT